MMTSFLIILLLASSTMAKSEEVDLSSPHHLLAHLSGLMENITALSNRPHLDQAAMDKLHKAKVGEEVRLPCRVENQGNNTVLWTKATQGGDNVLTANKMRVTPDQRIDLIHSEGGEMYLLLINNLTTADSGLYSCELNTHPPLRSFHRLQVEAPSKEAVQFEDPSLECCLARNVSKSCLGFCSITNIMSSTTKVKPGSCESSFPTIVDCLADQRDHLPCCLRAGVPLYCRDMCHGRFNKVTDHLKTHFDCSPHLLPTLRCLAQGLRKLPSRPELLAVEPVNSTAITIKWRSDPQLDDTSYKINVTLLKQLDEQEKGESETTIHSIRTSKARNVHLTIGGLKALGLYEVTLWAENPAGKSLPTYSVKVATRADEKSQVEKSTKSKLLAQLPDTEACCAAKNVSPRLCRQKFCNPLNLKQVTEEDMVWCLKSGSKIFSCLADNKDHTTCCRQRNIPTACLKMCSGSLEPTLPTDIVCLPFMSELSSCLLQGYGVLPSPPRDLKVSDVHNTWAVLQWQPPETPGNTVQDYVVFWSEETDGQLFWHNTQSPYILEGLKPESTYQVYIEAKNSYGKGEPSSTISFRTKPEQQADLATIKYDHKECCESAKMRPECLPLCSYNVTMAEVKR